MRPTGHDRDELLRAAVAAPSMHNTQPWSFRITDCVIGVARRPSSCAGSRRTCRSAGRTGSRTSTGGSGRRTATARRDLAATPADLRRPGSAFERDPQLAKGLSTSLLNQAIEHDSLRWLLHDPLGAWTRPQAVIRFGYGPPVPPTPRRLIRDVLLG